MTNATMHKSNIPRRRVFHEQKFRIPSPLERELGLWVDRIGASANQGSPRRSALRILGQYAAVHVLSGRGRFLSATAGEVSVAAPDVMLLFPDEPAAYWPEGSWNTLWIVWKGEDADRLARCGYLDPRQPVVEDRLGVVRQAHAAIKRVLRREDRDAALQRKRIILELAHGLYRAAAQHQRPMDARVAEAITLMAGQGGGALSIAGLAADLHMSATHFRRIFRAHIGVGPAQFRMTQRIARAKELLSAGATMKAAALQTGFHDVFHFMRAFKRVVGLTPGRFVANERGTGVEGTHDASGGRLANVTVSPPPLIPATTLPHHRART